ncbi:MAG: SMC-Scp complex subunit ScpB [Phycisphaerales bacterium]|nr:SMC-Scp complex subunit ScpB [Phycisphaerales bacterium]
MTESNPTLKYPEDAPPVCADQPLAARVEAVLFASDRPISDGRIVDLLGIGAEGGVSPNAQIRAAVNDLNAQYESGGRAYRIESVAGGRQVLTLSMFAPLVERLRGARAQQRLSQAALETLAIIAYRQPILRADAESIRGVACGEVMRSLMERRLVRIVGRAEVLGRPMLYGTTSEFLKVFGMGSIADLPASGISKS